jgi:protein-S-isoprenylcysteine O-methyltransferase Ste14
VITPIRGQTEHLQARRFLAFHKNIMKEKKGEHPFGDTGQLILLGIFLVVWVSDTFFFHWSTFLSVLIPLYLRIAFLGLALLLTFFLVRSAHFVVSQNERPNYVVDTGAFHYVVTWK